MTPTNSEQLNHSPAMASIRREELEHPRMAAAPEHLDVGAAGRRGIDAQNQFPIAGTGYRQVSHLDVLGPQQDRATHGFGQ